MTGKSRSQSGTSDAPNIMKRGKRKPRKNMLGAGALFYAAVPAAVVGVALIAYHYIKSQTSEPELLVGADSTVSKVSFEVPCSKDYEKENFLECKPKKCGRVVMDGLVSEQDAQHLLILAKRGLSLGGSNGGASILDLHSGALSKGDVFVDIYQLTKAMDLEIFSEKDFEIYRRAKNSIHQAIANEFKIPEEHLFLTKPTFFSRMNTTAPKTIHDEYWHPHVDKETYGSFHYTSLLYLSTYKHDFTGGRFFFLDNSTKKSVEPKLGRVSFFTSGSENIHHVEQVRDGVRYAITISFTCDPQKAISDPVIR